MQPLFVETVSEFVKIYFFLENLSKNKKTTEMALEKRWGHKYQ